MIHILAVSDIHIPTRMARFPYDFIKSYMNDIDYIFGLGDYVDQKTLDILYEFGKEVFAISGNMDESLVKSSLSYKLKITIENITIGLIHGWGGEWGIHDKIRKEFDDIDLICYGHTHSSFFKKVNGIYFFNPGSLCSDKPSFGIITINNKTIDAKIHSIG